jgi:CheY-like chemotaxis protein
MDFEIAARDFKPIALSARAMKGDGEMFVEKGFNGYIANPAAVKGFLETLEDYPEPPNGSAGRSTA